MEMSAEQRALIDRLLAAMKALGLTAQKVEQLAEIPPAWISKAKYGRVGDRAPAWGNLQRWLDTAFPEPPPPPGSEPRAPRPVLAPVAPAPLPALPIGRPPTSKAAKPEGLEELIAAIRNSDSLEKSEALLTTINEMRARGIIDGPMTKSLVDIARERRATQKAIAEEQARMDSSKPVQVVVRYVNDWQKKRLTGRSVAE